MATPTKPRERGILFSAPMVRALLRGTKTQTRRIANSSGSCPYGQPGDKLWVREALDFGPDGTYYYRADKQPIVVDERLGYTGTLRAERLVIPCIFMPRTACRLFLEITDVRMERLVDISEADAVAEGVKYANSFPGAKLGPYDTAKLAFHRLWEDIHDPDSWEENPWVWAISFRVIEQY